MATALRLSTEDLAALLARARHEPRRNLKRFLKDRGGDGSAAELDQWLARAERNAEAVALAERLEKERAATARNIDLGMEARVAEMLGDVYCRMKEQGLTQAEVAARCGWTQPLVAAYLSGRKEPGARNLAKLASAVGRVWRLTTPHR
jgi:hypothetical protein